MSCTLFLVQRVWYVITDILVFWMRNKTVRVWPGTDITLTLKFQFLNPTLESNTIRQKMTLFLSDAVLNIYAGARKERPLGTVCERTGCEHSTIHITVIPYDFDDQVSHRSSSTFEFYFSVITELWLISVRKFRWYSSRFTTINAPPKHPYI